jgi:hypothetical protein
LDGWQKTIHSSTVVLSARRLLLVCGFGNATTFIAVVLLIGIDEIKDVQRTQEGLDLF